MEGTDFLHIHHWRPLTRFNLTHSFFTLNKETIVNTWIVLIALLLFILITRWFIKYRRGITSFITLSFVQYFKDLTSQTLGNFSARHFYFGTGLFIFLVFCNIITLLPWTEEPTTDINTTFALGIISFLYIQYYSIRTQGIRHYLKEFISPIFIMLPLHLIGKLSSIISLSFRLFGNIFGGAMITRIFLQAIQGSLFLELAGLPLNMIIVFFFIIFEGVLQAFVFSMLSMTYLALAIKEEGPLEGGNIP